MEIKGRLSGRVRDLSIQNSGTLTYKESAIKEVRDLSVGIDSIIHAEAAIQLKVSRNYTNQGSIMSDDKISLQIENLAKDQTGTLYAPNGVSTRVMSAERAKVRHEAECREVKRKRAEAERQARIAQENAKKEREAAEKEARFLEKQLEDLRSTREYRIYWIDERIAEVKKSMTSDAARRIYDKYRSPQPLLGGEYRVYLENLDKYKKLDELYQAKDAILMEGIDINRIKAEAPRRRKHRGMVFSFGVGSGGFHFGGHTSGYDPFPIGRASSSPMQTQAMLFKEKLTSSRQLLQESMAKVERLRALERQPIYTPSISMPTPSRTPSRVGTVYTTVTPVVSEIRDREYISRLFRGARDEASSVYSDPNMRLLFTSIRDWTGIEPIKQAFPRMRRPIEILESLRRDAAADRGWWETYFCPPEHERVSRLQESLDNPVDSFVREHPEFLLGPVSLGLQGLETAGAIAIQRVAPKLLAVGIVATSWENFVNYMKGGKDAVSRAAGSGPSKERVVPNRDKTVAYHERMVDSGKWKRCTGEWKGYFEGEVKGSTYRFKPTFEKAEFEVYEKFSGRGRHCGVLRAEGEKTGEVLDEFAKGIISSMKW